MTAAGERSMPVIDAYPVVPLRGDHWRARFVDGERTYPSRDSMARAAARIGTAVRFHEPVRGSRSAQVVPPAPARSEAPGPHFLPPHAGSDRSG